ncbi:PEP-CTERM sorting domain-containing protein [Aquabacterium sp.]|uniref:PEP-CTERM sorting domain-containing protein n=1 Tax=Aquabacterium sp. TaxID=1872578 RepID=UPI004037C470
MKTLISATALLAALGATSVQAAGFTSGNILVSNGSAITEYTTHGDLVQSIATTYPGGYPATEYARDLAMPDTNSLYLFNGTFQPYVSRYDVGSASWSNVSVPGLSSVNAVSYGGIAASAKTIFVADMMTYSGGEAQGIVAIDRSTNTATRFATNIEPIDLSLGNNGLLYALSPGGSPDGRTLDVYNPDTLAHVQTIDLTKNLGWNEHKALAVDQKGDIFLANSSGLIEHLDATGKLLGSLSPTCSWSGSPSGCSFTDVDIIADGTELVLGTRFGEVFLVDTGLKNWTSFKTDGMFVAFASAVPEPSSYLLMALGLLAMGVVRRKMSN